MTHRIWLGLLLSAGWLAAGNAAAQDEYPFDVKDRNALGPIRSGEKSFQDAVAANQESVNRAARWAVMRLTDPIHRGIKQGPKIEMSVLVDNAAKLMVDAVAPSKPMTQGQRDYSQALGKAAVGHLRTVLGSKDKPSTYEGINNLIVRVNAARILSFVGKSGYEDAADLAVEVIENPKEHDAVRLYALQTLRFLFTVNHPENPKASIVTKPDRELKAIQTLIAFIGRKPPLTDAAGPEEVEGQRYVRREAIRALGNVRKPIIRKDKTIVAEPALWLLKVASMDEVIPLTPSLAERMEAMIGYFQLNPDRGQNVDFAIYWTGAALVEFAAVAKARPDPKLDSSEPMKGKEVSPPEYYGWRFAAARLHGAMKEWKEAWDLEHPSPPQPQAKMVAELTEKSKIYLFDPLLNTAEKKEIETDPLKAWWAGQTWPNRTLYKESATAIVTPIKRDQ